MNTISFLLSHTTRVVLVAALGCMLAAPQARAHAGIDFSIPDWYEDNPSPQLTCRRADANQVKSVNAGFAKLREFLTACAAATSGSRWCNELIRPNPASISYFRCTYDTTLPHNLVHPDESTWPHAFQAVSMVEELEAKGITACLIYNWWRPEPYNRNVGGAPGRHPFGTAVDVRFCSMEEMEKAHAQLCEWRKQGRLRALGYYGTTALHLGIADQDGNTWGKSCP